MKAKTRNATTADEKTSFIPLVLKGSLIALSISLIAVLIFAFVLRFLSIPDGAIKPVNQVIKTFSILVGVFMGLRKSKEMGLISGLVIGIVYTVLSFVAFSALYGNFEFTRALVNDLLFGAIIGGICGVIAVNFRKK